MPRRPGSSISRRFFLLGFVAALTAACSAEPAPRPLPPEPDPDEAIRNAAVADIQDLVANYDVTLAAHPALGRRLSPLRAENVAHLTALGARPLAPTTPPARPTSTSSASSTQSPATRPQPTPAKAASAAPAMLAAREAASAAARLAQLGGASGPLARLLASIGASESTHALVLRSNR